jgi:hypothetical protein
MPFISQEEVEVFQQLSFRLGNFLKILMKSNPLLKNEWEFSDLYQEIALKYFKKLPEISSKLKEGDHRFNLLRKMAKQIVVDKLRNLQRKKRDVKKELRNQDLNEIKYKYSSPNKTIIFSEEINDLKLKINNDIWEVLEWRSEGKSWEKCAQKLANKLTGSALRMKVKRHVASLA